MCILDIYVYVYSYTQSRVSRSKLVRLKVLLCAHDCCNRSMHGIVLGGLDGNIINFMLVLWLATESVGVIGMMMRLNTTGMNNSG